MTPKSATLVWLAVGIASAALVRLAGEEAAPAPTRSETWRKAVLFELPFQGGGEAVRPPLPAVLAPDAQPHAVPDTVASAASQDAIILLPRYLVRANRDTIPDGRHVLSGKGETALAMHRYITETDRALNFFTLPLFGTPKEARARAMLREQLRLEDLTRYQDLINLTKLTNPNTAKKLKNAVDQTFMRDPQFEK